MKSSLVVAVIAVTWSLCAGQNLDPYAPDDALYKSDRDNAEAQTEYPNGVNVIPGEAELDYPVFHKIPKTSFSCEGRIPGFYADVEARCQAWHTCDVDRRMQTFLCPNGTIYSQSKRVCEWWYNVNCEKNEVNRFYDQNRELYITPKVTPEELAAKVDVARKNPYPSTDPLYQQKEQFSNNNNNNGQQQQQSRPSQQQNQQQPQRPQQNFNQQQQPQQRPQQQPQPQQNFNQQQQQQQQSRPAPPPQQNFQQQQSRPAPPPQQNFQQPQNRPPPPPTTENSYIQQQKRFQQLHTQQPIIAQPSQNYQQPKPNQDFRPSEPIPNRAPPQQQQNFQQPPPQVRPPTNNNNYQAPVQQQQQNFNQPQPNQYNNQQQLSRPNDYQQPQAQQAGRQANPPAPQQQAQSATTFAHAIEAATGAVQNPKFTPQQLAQQSSSTQRPQDYQQPQSNQNQNNNYQQQQRPQQPQQSQQNYQPQQQQAPRQNSNNNQYNAPSQPQQQQQFRQNPEPQRPPQRNQAPEQPANRPQTPPKNSVAPEQPRPKPPQQSQGPEQHFYTPPHKKFRHSTPRQHNVKFPVRQQQYNNQEDARERQVPQESVQRGVPYNQLYNINNDPRAAIRHQLTYNPPTASATSVAPAPTTTTSPPPPSTQPTRAAAPHSPAHAHALRRVYQQAEAVERRPLESQAPVLQHQQQPHAPRPEGRGQRRRLDGRLRTTATTTTTTTPTPEPVPTTFRPHAAPSRIVVKQKLANRGQAHETRAREQVSYNKALLYPAPLVDSAEEDDVFIQSQYSGAKLYGSKQ